MEDNNRIWQTRVEMPIPTNPLQGLVEMLTSTSRDISEDRLLSAIYGVVVGWDNASYKELKEKHNWTDAQIQQQKTWHSAYNEAWNLFMSNNYPQPNKQ